MKNYFLPSGLRWLVIPLFFSWAAAAQSSLGIQGGLHMSNATVIGPTPFVTSPQGNFFLGGTLRLPLRQPWTFSSDILYTRRGFFFDNVKYSPQSGGGFRLVYIEVTGKAEYHLFKNVHLQMGSYVGYLADEHVYVMGPEGLVQPAYTMTDRWDVGLQGGLAAYFQRWSAFVRYSHGLKSIGRLNLVDENGGPIGSLHLFNRGLQVGAGYRIFNW